MNRMKIFFNSFYILLILGYLWGIFFTKGKNSFWEEILINIVVQISLYLLIFYQSKGENSERNAFIDNIKKIIINPYIAFHFVVSGIFLILTTFPYEWYLALFIHFDMTILVIVCLSVLHELLRKYDKREYFIIASYCFMAMLIIFKLAIQKL